MPILFLIMLSIPALKSLSKSGFYTSHDGETHTVRIAQYYLALKDGQVPPRFATSLYQGLGSPIFVYIYPLPYILGSLLHFLSLSFVDSFKLLMALCFIGSGLSSYFWLKGVFKSEKAAFLGALYYTWVPYRFSLIYVRASISEMLAYTFLPLTLFCLTKLAVKRNETRTAATAISLAIVLLSQNLVALISLPLVGAYLLVQSLFSKSFKVLILGIIALMWGFAISSFTYLPSLLERNYTRFDETFSKAYLDHFVTIEQLIRSPWDYGFDLKGTINDKMSFQIGLAHILIATVTILMLIYFLVTKKRLRKELILAFFFLLFYFTAIVLMLQTNFTISIWEKFKFLQIIDLPWRLLGLVSVCTSFFAACLAKSIKPGLVFIFLVLAVLIANRNHLRINEAVIHDNQYFENYTNTATQYNEFTPRWRQSTREPIGFTPNKKVEITSGDGQIFNINSKSNRVKFGANITSPEAQIQINKFYFPQTVLSVDGKNLPQKDLIITDPNNTRLDVERDTSGLVALNLKSGSHMVDLKYQETPLRTFANLISLVSLILALFLIFKNAQK